MSTDNMQEHLRPVTRTRTNEPGPGPGLMDQWTSGPSGPGPGLMDSGLVDQVDWNFFPNVKVIL